MRKEEVDLLRAHKIVFMAMAAGQVFFCLAAVYLSRVEGPYNSEVQYLELDYVVAVLAGLAIIFENFLYKQQLIRIRKMPDLNRRYAEQYKSAKLVSWAIIEGASLFSIVAFYINGNLMLLAIFGLLILNFLRLRPSMEGMKKDLQLGELNENEI